MNSRGRYNESQDKEKSDADVVDQVVDTDSDWPEGPVEDLRSPSCKISHLRIERGFRDVFSFRHDIDVGGVTALQFKTKAKVTALARRR